MKLPRWDRHGYLFAIACVAAATALFLLGRAEFAKGQWALLYLLIVVVVAGTAGFRASLIAAVLSFFAWNFFFLPPYNTLFIHDPKDWLSLIVFLVVGIAMGLQTGRMREREEEARAREEESALLNRLSSSLVSVTSVHTMASMLPAEITATTGAQTTVLFLSDPDGRLPLTQTPADAETTAENVHIATWVCDHNKAVGLPHIPSLTRLGVEGWPVSVAHGEIERDLIRQDIYLPIQTTTRVEGALYVGARPDERPYSAHEARLLVSIANLVAGFLERQRLEAEAGRAQALHEGERLKSTLVSSVSHELKTPLAAVTASITSLLEEDIDWDPAAVRSELLAVNDDLTRLNDSIGALLDLSRLKSDAWSPQRDWYEFGEILGATLNKLPEGQRGRFAFAIPEDLPAFYVDFQQLSRALLHLLENALAYSPPAASITVGAAETLREVHFWVEDRGPGVPVEERERIFEQFFRGATRTTTGTGLGLAITAEIIHFHHGRIWVEGVRPHGARFVVAIPREPATGDVS
ncbi:MAG TPA: DUF4118 domain-containing protein [Armatimonadota bacterium]|jgi:two-component system sensor histidine kinase KdpD